MVNRKIDSNDKIDLRIWYDYLNNVFKQEEGTVEEEYEYIFEGTNEDLNRRINQLINQSIK